VGFWQALEIVLREAVAARREPERVELARAAGLVLAGDARATMALPPFPASIMDGYAVVASVHSSLSLSLASPPTRLCSRVAYVCVACVVSCRVVLGHVRRVRVRL
jgi:hypothetical protein